MMRSVKFAFRTLFKTPFVTAIAILSLALGIGANAAIFSLFDQMLLRSLPVNEPGELVNFSAPGPKPGSTSCNQAGDCDEVFSYAMFRDLERDQTTLTGVAAHRIFGANIAFRNQTMAAEGTMVSGRYFGLIGIQPAIGRLLMPSDDETIGAHHVVVLSHSYWENHLGSDPSVLNETITINGTPMTIVGVAPEGFQGTTLGGNPRVFVPISMRGYMNPGFTRFEDRRAYWAYVFGRLKPGSTIEQAQLAINAVYKRLINEVEAPLQEGMSDQTMAQFRAKEIALAPGYRGQSSIHEDAKTPLLLLFAITGTVLLIACANIANLLLARAATRSTEMAVRLSLGASRRRVIGPLLLESCILALMGGIASLVIAKVTLAGFAALLPPDATQALQLTMDWGVVLFAAVLAIGTGLLFGLFPAIHSTRPNLIGVLRANTGQPSGARSAARFRTSLVTVQIALSMALLISAGLFLKSLANVSRVDLGIRIDNVIAFGISPSLNGYDSVQSRQLFERVEQELAALPGVTGVAAGMVPLLSGSNWGNSVSVEGFERGPDTDAGSRYNEIGPGYFKTLGVTLLAGREFTDSDVLGSGKVAVVNEAFAKKFGLGRDAVGKWMAQGGIEDSLDVQIVGLVQDAKYSDVKDEIPPVYYVPYRQNPRLGFNNFYVRSALPPEQILRAVPTVISRLDPNLPVEELKTLPQQVRENIFLDRMISTMSAAFAVLATLLAAIGLYGVLAYTVSQRTREIGLRMALGAEAGRVRGMVLKQVSLMIAIGGVIGIIAAIALGRAAGSLLYGLKGWDPIVIASSTLLLGVVALGAGYVPAMRASRVDPMQALRYE
jgi:predicted permease